MSPFKLSKQGVKHKIRAEVACGQSADGRLLFALAVYGYYSANIKVQEKPHLKMKLWLCVSSAEISGRFNFVYNFYGGDISEN